METVEQRTRCRQGRMPGMELLQVDVQVFDCSVVQGHHAALVPFPGQCQVCRFHQGEVPEGECGDFADACRGLVEQYQEYAVAARLHAGPVVGGKERLGRVYLQVVDGFPGRSSGLERLGCLVQGHQSEVLLGGVAQECPDRGQAQAQRLWLVVLGLAHPDQPLLEEPSLEVVEADVLALNLLLANEVVDEAFQADPVCFDGFWGQCPDFGHVFVQVVPGVAPEVRGIVSGVAFHANPTSGRSPWPSRARSA